jgi:hypothetical protein
MRIISVRCLALAVAFVVLIVGTGERLASASPRSTVDFRPGVTKLSNPTTSGATKPPSKCLPIMPPVALLIRAQIGRSRLTFTEHSTV